MLTTVVGSYPAHPQAPKSFGDKLLKFIGSYDQYKPSISLAVSDQLKAGIDLVSDGQVRGDMVEIFARHIPGMIVEEGTCKIKGKINPPVQSIGSDDLKFALKILKNTLNQLNIDPNLNNDLINKKGVKGIITGPTTMVYSSRIEGFYDPSKKDKAVLDMASALKKEAQFLETSGASVIQLDEPFISTGLVNMGTAKKAVEIISKDLSIPVALHVCGDVEQVFSKILKFNVDIVDCEFAGIPHNIDLLESQSSFNNKKIGFGCLDTKKESVETIGSILTLLKKGADIIGVENMLIDPDCGMRMLPRDAAFSKLKNMVEASKVLD
ncbi:methionine synthase [Methanobacterium alcaliphilum]|uniref:methionine synthase n=1 Tax=Methanobacterium alcaliphilum TaxID=392018 RepID=UPI00200A49B3|nr:methionine synthase [Methanobacterium alcaliphilum]MCK9150828.1 methionine synthase [Methanobacterium alcaliphilum]